MYDLLTLIMATKQIKRPNMLLWALFVKKTVDHRTTKFEVHTKNARRIMAPFVGKYVDGELIEKEGAYVNEFQPGILKPFTRAHAEDLLTQNFGQTIYGDKINSEDVAEDQVTEELRILNNAVSRRENWLLGKLLTTGVMPIVGKTVDRAVTFGDINQEVLSGTDLWTDSASDPLEYLKTKRLEVLKESGESVDTLILTPEASSAFQSNQKIKDALKYPMSNLLRFDPSDLGDGSSYVGYIPEINTHIFTFADWVIDPSTDTEVPLLPAGGMIYGKYGMLEVHYGAIAQKEDEKSPRQLFVGSRIPKFWGKGDEDFIRLASAPLPVPNDVRGWCYAKVV